MVVDLLCVFCDYNCFKIGSKIEKDNSCRQFYLIYGIVQERI